MQDVITVVSSVGVSGLLTAGLIFLAREWIGARIKNAIQHEYNEKLESHKTQLKLESDITIEQFKVEMQQLDATRAVATASFSASHIAAHNRRLDAIDRTWKIARQFRSKLYQVTALAHLLSPKAPEGILDNPKVVQQLDEITNEVINEALSPVNEIHDFRPFLGEKL